MGAREVTRGKMLFEPMVVLEAEDPVRKTYVQEPWRTYY